MAAQTSQHFLLNAPKHKP